MSQSIFSRMLPENMRSFAQNNPVLNRNAQRISAAIPGVAPIAAGVALGAAGATGFAGYQNRQRDPERLARQAAQGEQLQPWAQEYLANNPEAAEEYTKQLEQQLQGQVRFGGLSPQEARDRRGDTDWSFAESVQSQTNPYSANVQGPAGDSFGPAAKDSGYESVGDYRQSFGYDDFVAAGVPDPRSYQLQRDYLSQSVIDADQLADTPARGNMRREMNYIRPVERDRNLENFAMADSQNQRQLQRDQALKLASGYENMINGLRI